MTERTLADVFLADFAEEEDVGSSLSIFSAPAELEVVKVEDGNDVKDPAIKLEGDITQSIPSQPVRTAPIIRSTLLDSGKLDAFLSLLTSQGENDKESLANREKALAAYGDKLIEKKEKDERSGLASTDTDQLLSSSSSSSTETELKGKMNDTTNNNSDSDSSDSDSDTSNSDSSSSDDSDSEDDDTARIARVNALGLEDDEAEYALLNRANEVIKQIDEEIISVHRRVRDIYSARFPSLEEYVNSPVEYARCVMVFNDMPDMSSSETIRAKLLPLFPQQQVFSISIIALSTAGKPLPQHLQDAVVMGCECILTLDTKREQIRQYIQGRLTVLAPNLSALISPPLASQLLGLTGGLNAMLRVPACNLQVVGAKRRPGSVTLGQAQEAHTGILGKCDIVVQTPPKFKRKVLRMISSKCALAGRMDLFHEDPSGDAGAKLRADILECVRKWLEPPPMKLVKALPKPMEVKRNRRGGRRARQRKEREGITELRKQQNRVMFGQAEIVDDFTGEGMGLIGQSGTGVLRVVQEHAEKAGQKHKVSKQMQEKLNKMKARQNIRHMPGAATGVSTAVGGHVTGIASSLVNGPAQASLAGGAMTTLSGIVTSLGNAKGGGLASQGLARSAASGSQTTTTSTSGGSYFDASTGFVRVRKASEISKDENGTTKTEQTEPASKRPKPPVPTFN